MAFYSIAFSRGRERETLRARTLNRPLRNRRLRSKRERESVISRDACISLFNVDSINWRGAECVVVVGWRTRRFCASCHCLHCGSALAPHPHPLCHSLNVCCARGLAGDELVAEQTATTRTSFFTAFAKYLFRAQAAGGVPCQNKIPRCRRMTQNPTPCSGIRLWMAPRFHGTRHAMV